MNSNRTKCKRSKRNSYKGQIGGRKLKPKGENGQQAVAAVSAKKPMVPKAKKPASKPTRSPTATLVNDAIKALKERGGSSMRAIKKYIAANNKVDAEKLAPFIKKYLRSAVEKRILIQTKGKGASGSFKLSATALKPKVKKKKPLKKAKADKPKRKAGTPKVKSVKPMNGNDDPPPSIFKLDIDCCEELFAFLSMEDLHSLGQTCKRMNQYTGYFVRENYKSGFTWTRRNLDYGNIIVDGFMEFVSNLYMFTDSLNSFARFAPNFKSINDLELVLSNKLKDDQMVCLQEILKKCEKIKLDILHKNFKEDLYEKVLKFCKNMKHLEVMHSNTPTFKYDNNWLLREYPNLRYLDFYSKAEKVVSSDKLQRFFDLNKCIRRLRINKFCLLDNQHWIVNTDIQLDELSVDRNEMTGNEISACVNLLSKMFEKGFYKHLTLDCAYPEAPLPLLGLKECKITSQPESDLEFLLVNNVSTIELIDIPYCTFEHILTCLRIMKNLKEIQTHGIRKLRSIDVARLAEERKKLSGACKVTIYLNRKEMDVINGTTDVGLVKVKWNT